MIKLDEKVYHKINLKMYTTFFHEEQTTQTAAYSVLSDPTCCYPETLFCLFLNDGEIFETLIDDGQTLIKQESSLEA